MSGTPKIGNCSLCRQAVFGGDGTPENPGRIKRGGKRVPHHHRKPWTLEREEPSDPGDYRYWWDSVPGFARG